MYVWVYAWIEFRFQGTIWFDSYLGSKLVKLDTEVWNTRLKVSFDTKAFMKKEWNSLFEWKFNKFKQCTAFHYYFEYWWKFHLLHLQIFDIFEYAHRINYDRY